MLTDGEIKAELHSMLVAIKAATGREQSDILHDAIDGVPQQSLRITLREIHESMCLLLSVVMQSAKRKRGQ
jgi:hypothetical protein